MTRSPLSMPRALMLGLLASLALVGCDRGGDAAPPPKGHAPEAGTPKTDVPKTDAPRADAPQAPAAPAKPPPPPEAPLADGWTRLDLSTLDGSLTGTVDLPPGIKASVRIEQASDADGLTVNRPSVQIGPRGCGVNLAPLAEKPTRFESAEAMARSMGASSMSRPARSAPIIGRWFNAGARASAWATAGRAPRASSATSSSARAMT